MSHKRILSAVAIVAVVGLAACSPSITAKLGQTQMSSVSRDLGFAIAVHDGGPTTGDSCVFGVLSNGVGAILLANAPPAGVVFEAVSWGVFGADAGWTLSECLSIWDNAVSQDAHQRWLIACNEQRTLKLESRTNNAYVDMGNCMYQGWFAGEVAGWAVYMAWWAANFGG